MKKAFNKKESVTGLELKNLNLVDLTGAGDLFHWYLHGYLNNFSQKDCLEKVQKCLQIIQQMGARL